MVRIEIQPIAPASSLTSNAASKVPKKLFIMAVRGEELVSKDANGLSDPFVELRLGKQVKQTKTIFESLSPEWNDTLEFDLTPQDQTVEAAVFDSDKGRMWGTTHEYMGSAVISLAEILSMRETGLW